VISIEEIRRRIRAGELSDDQALLLANVAVQEEPSAGWWLLRGRLILLSEGPGYQLEDAAASFQQALLLEPDNPEPYEELGHYYDIQIEPERARFYFRAALERGAGPACAEALAAVEEE
jgi:Flp pilus assembly protein TadD